MAEIAVSKLTQVVNHAAIGNCFVAVQKGAGASSTNRASVSSLQINYSRVANAYPGVNGDGNARGNRTVTGNGAVPAGNVNDMWYDYGSQLAILSGARIIREETPATWTYINEIYARTAGTWKQVLEAWIKDTGAWRRFLYVIPTTNLYLNGAFYNINLRSYYQQQTGDYTQTPMQVFFILPSGSTIGSTSTSSPAIATGIWPAGSKIWLWVFEGAQIAGKGGAAGIVGTKDQGGNRCSCASPTYCCNNTSFGRQAGTNGGDLVLTNTDFNLVNDSSLLCGGGGGGAGSVFQAFVGGSQNSGLIGGGGGGAGLTGGQGCNLSVTCCVASELAGGCANRGWWKSKSCGGGNGSSSSGGAGGCIPIGTYQGGGTGGTIGGYGGSSVYNPSCDSSYNGGAPGYVWKSGGGGSSFTYYSNSGKLIYGLTP